MDNLFKQDLFLFYGLENHPQREELFYQAWEDGHASGYTEVLSYFDDAVENLK